MEHQKKRDVLFWGGILCLAALLASAPVFLGPPVFAGNDALFHWNRIEGIKESLLSGQFPVRVDAHAFGGYGMPTDIFYPDLFFYIPALLRLLGVPIFQAWEFYIVLVNLVTAFAGWWAFSAYARSRRTGAVATLFYLAFSYRLVDIYARAAGGEMMAMAFLPAAFVSAWVLLWRKTAVWPVVVLSFTGILQSHIITGVMLLAACLLMILTSFRRLQRADVQCALGKAACFTFLLNIWFYVPLLYVHRHMDYVMKHAVNGSVDGAVRSLSSMDFYMGSAMLFVLFGAIIVQLRYREGTREEWMFWRLLALSAIVLGLTSCPAFWKILGSSVGVLQFPFRLAVFPAVFLSLALALTFSKFHRTMLAVLCAAACLCGNLYWLIGNDYDVPPAPLRTIAEQIETVSSTPPPYPMLLMDVPKNEFQMYLELGNVIYQDYADVQVAALLHDSDGWRQAPMREKMQDREIHQDNRIQSLQRRGNAISFSYVAGAEEWIQLPLFWYPGYIVRENDGSVLPSQKDAAGQVSVHLPGASGVAHVRYEGLPWFHATDLLSWFSLFAFFYLVIRERQDLPRAVVLQELCRRASAQNPKKKIIIGAFVATLLLFLLMSAALHREKSHWIPFVPDDIEMVSDARAKGLVMEFHQTAEPKGVRLEGSIFDAQVPTMTASKSIIVQRAGSDEFYKVPTVMVERRDLTQQYGGPVQYKVPDWFRDICEGAREGMLAEFPYNGAGFAAFLSEKALSGKSYHIYLLDEDNGQRLLIDMHEEVAR